MILTIVEKFFHKVGTNMILEGIGRRVIPATPAIPGPRTIAVRHFYMLLTKLWVTTLYCFLATLAPTGTLIIFQSGADYLHHCLIGWVGNDTMKPAVKCIRKLVSILRKQIHVARFARGLFKVWNHHQAESVSTNLGHHRRCQRCYRRQKRAWGQCSAQWRNINKWCAGGISCSIFLFTHTTSVKCINTA